MEACQARSFKANGFALLRTPRCPILAAASKTKSKCVEGTKPRSVDINQIYVRRYLFRLRDRRQMVYILILGDNDRASRGRDHVVASHLNIASSHSIKQGRKSTRSFSHRIPN